MCLMDGFSRVTPAVLMAVFYGVSFSCLTLALKRIDVRVACAIWSGVGVALISGIGVCFFRELFTPAAWHRHSHLPFGNRRGSAGFQLRPVRVGLDRGAR